MSLSARFGVTGDTLINLPWQARGIVAMNPTGQPIYVRIGGNDYPTADSADLLIPPATYLTMPLPPTTILAARMAAAVLPSSLSTRAILVLTEKEQPAATTNINLPQVVSQPTLFSNPALSCPGQAAVTNIFTPAAGKGTLVYQMWGDVIPAVSDNVSMQIKTSAGVFILDWLGTTARQTCAPYTFAPNGLVVPVGVSIQAVNNGALLNPASLGIYFNYAYI